LLSASPVSTLSGIYTGFMRGMRELGYVEGKDFVIEWRSAEGQYGRLSDVAAELARLNVDVIVTGVTAGIRPLQQATTTIPIVMAYSTDPVGNGFVASLARPGGNTTGLAGSSDELVSQTTGAAGDACPECVPHWTSRKSQQPDLFLGSEEYASRCPESGPICYTDQSAQPD
jgi:ABC-type uncharacterized transport system substrate-binding protein